MTTDYAAKQLGRAIIDAVKESMSEDERIPTEHIENFSESVEEIIGNMDLEVKASRVDGLGDEIESRVTADYIWDAIEDKVGETVTAQSANKEWLIDILRNDSEIQSILKFKIRAYLRENLRMVVREMLTDFLRSTEQNQPDHAVPITSQGELRDSTQREPDDNEGPSSISETLQRTLGLVPRGVPLQPARTNGEGAIVSGDPQVPPDNEIPF